jgi:diaminopimelate decarboxylase
MRPGKAGGEPLPPLPGPVLDALADLPASGPRLSLPGFLYRLPLLRQGVREVAAAFPLFHFPLKCNPNPQVVRAVLEEGGGLSLRSFGELDLALKLGANPEKLSFTGWGLGPALMGRLIRAGVTVNLDSAREVAGWVRHFPGEPFGVRLMAGDDPEYLSAGFAHEEVGPMLEGARDARAWLAGVLVHWPHQVATAEEMAAEFAPLPRLLANTLGDGLSALEYLDLGGGWPAPYAGGDPIPAAAVAEALYSTLYRELELFGFSGRLMVEPGRAVAASCGYWAARVAKVEGETVTLDTPPPTPPYCLPYPAHLLRVGASGFAEVREERTTLYRLLGLASPPVDVIRAEILLPPLREGDVLVFSQAGAYLGTGLLMEGWKGTIGETVLDD